MLLEKFDIFYVLLPFRYPRSIEELSDFRESGKQYTTTFEFWYFPATSNYRIKILMEDHLTNTQKKMYLVQEGLSNRKYHEK